MSNQVNWYYVGPSGQMGPVSREALDTLVRDKLITPETLVWCSGQEGWKRAEETELREQFSSDNLPPPLPQGPPPVPTYNPEDNALEREYDAIFGAGPAPAPLNTARTTDWSTSASNETSMSLGDKIASARGGREPQATHSTPVHAPVSIGPMEAVQLLFSRGFQATGRATRAEFWWSQLFMLVVLVVAAAIGQAAFTITCLALLVPSITQGIRRMHDVDQSGWWVLLALVFFPAFYLVAAGASVPYARPR